MIAHGLQPTIEVVRDVVGWGINELKARFPGVPILISLGNNDFYLNYGTKETDHEDFASIGGLLREFMDDTQYASFLKGGYYYQANSTVESKQPTIKLRLATGPDSLKQTKVFIQQYADRCQ